MHHLTPRGPTDSICRKDHPCIESSASHFRLFPLTMGDRRWAPAGRAVPPIWRGFGLLEMGDSKASDPADLGAYGLLGHGFGLRSSPDPGFSLELSTSERL